MARSTVEIVAPVDAVYEALMDAWTYAGWVRGAKRIRDVDAHWPAPGSRFHHTVGMGPLSTRDETKMLRAEPGQLVELEVRTWPGGQGIVRVELEPDGDRTQVVLHEQPTRGPLALVDGVVQQWLIQRRNDSSLRKLKKIVEQRWRMRR